MELTTQPVSPEFVMGGGELGKRIREFDWSATPLGEINSWPQSLRTCIRIMLTSRQPIWIGWGRELIKLYNDPYKAIVGGKHPWALGTPASVVWKDIWEDIEPMLKQVMDKDEGTYVESQLLIMERNGYPEETYYTFSYTPIPGDDGKTAGMFCANTDDTDRIISERQLKTLTSLGKRLTDSKSNPQVVSNTMLTLGENPQDFPFALFYTCQDNLAVLEGSTELGEKRGRIPDQLDLQEENEFSFIFKKAGSLRKAQVFENLEERLGAMPSGAWKESPRKAIVLPIAQAGSKVPYGYLVVGLNPYRLLDEKYLGFFALVADQVATSFADVNVLQEERKRAEALAAIDRAKTTFFSNISHEFRTPLTLLLGPIEEVMHDPNTREENRVRMDVAHRNGLRMQKLVNTLLEFSRIEAGRMEGRFVKVDILSYTIDLASTFRSAMSKAGLEYQVNSGYVTGDVFVDIDLWEKIVLNLVSNAFKYTKTGKVEVWVGENNGELELRVKDTGVGIPKEHVQKIFERFHRVDNIHGRSQEGTGIGLAMVKELVKLHGGKIKVTSEEGKGSEFRVTIPIGYSHLPEEKIVKELQVASVSANANAFLQEALKWVPDESKTEKKAVSPSNSVPSIVLADDNADMRDYVIRLLSKNYEIRAAGDGEDALQLIRESKPDLVLSDIMMPRLDGFGLLKKIREEYRPHELPVIFLSARAGEEAKVEGFDAGAEDYLVKPFSAKELLARIDANIKLSRSRTVAEENIRNVIRQAPVAMTILKGKDHVIEITNQKSLQLLDLDYEAVINKKVVDVLPEVEGTEIMKILDQVYSTGTPFSAQEMPVQLKVNESLETFYFNVVYQPYRDLYGKVEGIISLSVDVTDMVYARKSIEESESYFRKLADTVPATIWKTDENGYCVYLSRGWYEMTGQTEEEALGFGWLDATHPEDKERAATIWFQANELKESFNVLYRLRQRDGSYRWSIDRGSPRYDSEGNFEGYIGSVVDVHEEKEASVKLQYLATLTQNIADAVIGTDSDYMITSWNKGAEKIYGYKEDEVLGKSTSDVIKTRFRNEEEKLTLRKILEARNHWQGEVVQQKKDGTAVQVFASISAIKDPAGNMIGAVAVNRDITVQKEAEQKIRQSEKEFRTLAETLPQLVWVTDKDGKQLYTSSRWKEYTGIEPNEENWNQIVHPDDQERVDRYWHGGRKSGEKIRYELRLKDSSGEYNWFFLEAVPLYNENNELIRWIGSLTNINEQKEIEKKLGELVDERTMELQRSNVDLQQFAHVASHDMKEPLRKIRIFSSRLEEENGSSFSPKGKEYLQKVISATNRMNAMIEGVLNYSMLNSTEQRAELVDLNEVIRHISTDLEILISQKGAHLKTDKLPVVEGAEVLLYQLFYNLINNSLKFSHTDRKPEIIISSRIIDSANGEKAEIVVKDNGIGFKEEFSETIFNTFIRLHPKDKYEGTGLGLSLCKRIAERHGGSISAHGEEGGAEFKIILPVTQSKVKI